MKAIIDGIQNIADIIVNIGEFIINIVKGFDDGLRILIVTLSEVAEVVNNMPTILKNFSAITVIVATIYLIIGWNAGRSDT